MNKEPGAKMTKKSTERNDPTKKKKDITHTEFMEFLAPFLELVDEKKIDLLKPSEPSAEAHISRSEYVRNSDILKDRLCACFIFKEEVSIDDLCGGREFTNDLRVLYEDRMLCTNVSFFQKMQILNEFQSSDSEGMMRRYIDQVKVNNERKNKIKEALGERLKMEGYYQLKGQLHKELDGQYKKMCLRKKKLAGTVDEEITKEYLLRMDEFLEIFGDWTQFPDDYYVHDDLFEKTSKHVYLD